MLEIFLIILPVFLVIAAGYVSARVGYLKAELADHLNTFAVRLAIPVLLFKAMYTLELSDIFDARMLAAFYGGAFVAFLMAIALARIIWKQRPGEAVAVGFCALFSNTLALGIPISERAWGAEYLPLAFAIVALHAGTMYAVGITFMEFAREDGAGFAQTFAKAARGIIANPLMIGSFAGIALNLGGVGLPEPLMDAVSLLAAAGIPAAMVGIGATLTRYKLAAGLTETLAVSALSLIVHPLIAFIAARYLFGLAPEYVKVAVLVAAMPPGMNVYIFATMYGRAVNLAASTVVVATALSVVTISMWLWLLQGL